VLEKTAQKDYKTRFCDFADFLQVLTETEKFAASKYSLDIYTMKRRVNENFMKRYLHTTLPRLCNRFNIYTYIANVLARI